ncbi:MAG: hypothetical protein AAF547_13540 [Actinomycetota bacterium]
MATKSKTTTTAKKAAEKVTETQATTLDRAEEFAGKAQEQYFSFVEQGQDAALRGYSAVIDAVGRIQLPAVPGMDNAPELPSLRIPTETLVEMSDNMFDFAVKVVENQREFAKKVLTAADAGK